MFTNEQITAIIPDNASLSAGKKLVSGSWLSLGKSEHFIWGEIKGSSSTPYQTGIDLSEPAFKCSCPSRKFPCKHAIALLFIGAENESRFTSLSPPDWMVQWMANRERKAEQQEAHKSKLPPTEKQVKDAEKRKEKRRKNVDEGVEEMFLRLNNMLKHGLTSFAIGDYSFWIEQASRMTNAQAPGLATIMKRCYQMMQKHPSRERRLITELSLLYLLLKSYRNIDTIDSLLKSDVESLIGSIQKKEDLLTSESANTITDHWLIFGKYKKTYVSDNLTAHYVWLYGLESKRFALILDFVFGNNALNEIYVPNTYFQGELMYWDSGFPLRAVVKQKEPCLDPLEAMRSSRSSFKNWEEMLDYVADVLAVQPWADNIPVRIDQVVLTYEQDRWLLLDKNEQVLPLHHLFPVSQIWHILTLSGGYPFNIWGLWDHDEFIILYYGIKEYYFTVNKLEFII